MQNPELRESRQKSLQGTVSQERPYILFHPSHPYSLVERGRNGAEAGALYKKKDSRTEDAWMGGVDEVLKRWL